MKQQIKKLSKKVFNKFGYELKKTKVTDDTDLYIKLYGKESVDNKRFYNICGAGHVGYGGGFYHPLWRNLDLLRPDVPGWDRSYVLGKDIEHDLLCKNELPIDDSSAEIIQSQFSIEHVNDDAAYFFFKEAHRTLKKKGILKIVVPNIDLDYLAYKNNDPTYFAIEGMSLLKYYGRSGFITPFNQATLEQVFLSRMASNATILHGGNNDNKITDEEFKSIMSKMPAEDAFTYFSSKCNIELQKKIRYNHINWWNHNKVMRALKKEGFSEISIMAPGQSASPVLRNRGYFDKWWNHVALFIEAYK